MKIKTLERETRRASDFGEEYQHVVGAAALEVASDIGYEFAEDVTAAFVIVRDGDYDEVWVTYSGGNPYWTTIWYTRLERVNLPDWYSGVIGENDYVAKCWFASIPAHNKDSSFWTDGMIVYSYNMKIGRTRDGLKEVLNARRFSLAIGEHIRELQRLGLTGVTIFEINPVRMEGKNCPSTKMGRYPNEWYRHDWLYFPDEAPQVNVNATNFRPGDRVVVKHTCSSWALVTVPAFAWGTVQKYTPENGDTVVEGYVLVALDNGAERFIRPYDLVIHKPESKDR